MTDQKPPELVRYVERVYKRHATLDLSLFQAGQERDFSEVALDRFYVPLRLAGRAPRQPPTEGADPLYRGRTKAGDAAIELAAEFMDLRSDGILEYVGVSHEQGLSRHLTLLGDAGSGKTTILRHLTGALARAWLDDDQDYARRRTGLTAELRVPLFVPLRHYHHYCQALKQGPISRRTFFNFLAAYFSEYDDLSLPADFYRVLLAGGQCLLALDGFDEVPGETARRQVVGVARDLANDPDIGQNIILLSSRVAAYGGATQLGGRFQTLWVQNLNPEEREAQIRRWVEAVSPHTDRPLKVEDILRRMPEGSSLDQLAVTPMIVTTICVVYFYDHELPEQRARLYRRCVDIMLYEKLRPDEPGSQLAMWAGTPDFKRELLARLGDPREGVTTLPPLLNSAPRHFQPLPLFGHRPVSNPNSSRC
jgi:predicted NACHT family NTPase